MGRPKGSKNKPRLYLTGEEVEVGKKPTAAQRHQAMKRQVALCVHDGMDEASIAAVLDLTVEKLRALFARELRHGRDLVRAEELMRLDAASADGNVAASKAILSPPGATGKP